MNLPCSLSPDVLAWSSDVLRLVGVDSVVEQKARELYAVAFDFGLHIGASLIHLSLPAERYLDNEVLALVRRIASLDNASATTSRSEITYKEVTIECKKGAQLDWIHPKVRKSLLRKFNGALKLGGL